jgi:hypothetical protein
MSTVIRNDCKLDLMNAGKKGNRRSPGSMRVLKGTCLLSPSVYHVLGDVLEMTRFLCQVLPTRRAGFTRWAFLPMHSSFSASDWFSILVAPFCCAAETIFSLLLCYETCVRGHRIMTENSREFPFFRNRSILERGRGEFKLAG